MSQTRLEYSYHCWDDCIPQGCPGHTAVLQFQSAADSLHYSDGTGQDLYMQLPQLRAFLSMLYKASGGYAQLESILRDALAPMVKPVRSPLTNEIIDWKLDFEDG